MDYKIQITPAAKSDIAETVDYLVTKLKNPTAAAHLIAKIKLCYKGIEKYPEMYEHCRDIRLRQKGYRKVVIDNYILIYHPVEADRTIYILRFFYGGRDYEKLI